VGEQQLPTPHPTTSGPLEAAAQFSESFRAAVVACFAVNLFQLAASSAVRRSSARAKDKGRAVSRA